MSTQFISPQNPSAEYEMSHDLYGGCWVQPLFSFKEEFSTEDDDTCLCTQSDQSALNREYLRYNTCSADNYRYNPELPADRLFEIWMKRGVVPESLADLISWEKDLL